MLSTEHMKYEKVIEIKRIFVNVIKVAHKDNYIFKEMK